VIVLPVEEPIRRRRICQNRVLLPGELLIAWMVPWCCGRMATDPYPSMFHQNYYDDVLNGIFDVTTPTRY
jgi:hypothetical protein